MRKPIELNYIKKSGMLYPDLQISNNVADDKQPIGKYGMMWLRFMKEWHYDRYIELRMDGKLLFLAHNVNNEAYELIKSQVKRTDYGMERVIIENTVIREFVLKVR